MVESVAKVASRKKILRLEQIMPILINPPDKALP
jgi:hypothetical protein